MNLVRPRAPVTGVVVSNARCMRGKSASFVRHTVIDVSGTPLAGNCLAGQSFGVIPPGVDEAGRPHKVRLYSIANPSRGEDGNPNWLSTTPKRLIDEYAPRSPRDPRRDHRLFLGVCSNYLCDLEPGDPVQLTGPQGRRFLLPVHLDAHDYLFLATGTGIAPFRGMLLEMFRDRGCTSRVELVMGVPYTTDLLYDDLFTDLAERHANFRYHRAISREGPNGRGRHVDALLDDGMEHFAGLIASRRTLIYVCGLAGMEYSLITLLARHGLIDDYFDVAPQLAARDPATWQPGDVRRRVKATARCLLEVY